MPKLFKFRKQFLSCWRVANYLHNTFAVNWIRWKIQLLFNKIVVQLMSVGNFTGTALNECSVSIWNSVTRVSLSGRVQRCALFERIFNFFIIQIFSHNFSRLMHRKLFFRCVIFIRNRKLTVMYKQISDKNPIEESY